MRKIRVLVIDDSVVVRRFISDLLTAEADMEPAGVAPNGRVGLQKIPTINPDLVVLDLEMPEMDGLATLTEIRRGYPHLPVIMYSSLTERGARATLDALELGANDYVTKPQRTASPEAARERGRLDLIPKIRALVNPGTGESLHNRRTAVDRIQRPGLPSISDRHQLRKGAVEILAIATSTGGPNALAAVLPQFPADFPVPIVIVQHMPPLFTSMLAERLDSKSEIKVSEARQGDVLASGHAYIAPGDWHMSVVRGATKAAIELGKGPRENSCRPAADVLFRSVAASHGAGSLAVVLTGMGSDGLRGCEHIRAAGGIILAQDEASSVVWGMPGFVARAGLAEAVLPLEQIAVAVRHRVRANSLSAPKGRVECRTS